MTDRFTPVMRAFVAAMLLLATATLMLVVVNTARAAGALAIGACGAFGEATISTPSTTHAKACWRNAKTTLAGW
jgi:hypothetical protein